MKSPLLIAGACCAFLISPAEAQIVSFDGNHHLRGEVHVQDGEPDFRDQIDDDLAVTELGASTHSIVLTAGELADATVTMSSSWTADAESVIGSVAKNGHIQHTGNPDPGAIEYLAFPAATLNLGLSETGTPYSVEVNWDFSNLVASSDAAAGWSVVEVHVGDSDDAKRYGDIKFIEPAPIGQQTFTGTTDLADLRVYVHVYGPGIVFTGGSTFSQDAIVDYEVLVGDAALPPDADSDGIADSVDNCTAVANPDQRDTDGDGFGNICDPDLNNDGSTNFLDLGLFKERFFTNDADADFNGDGTVNFLDLAVMKDLFLSPPGPSGLAL